VRRAPGRQQVAQFPASAAETPAAATPSGHPSAGIRNAVDDAGGSTRARERSRPTPRSGAAPSVHIQEDSVIAFDRLSALAPRLRAEWQDAQPFSHIVVDDLLPPDAAEQVVEGFDGTTDGWVFHNHYNERKYCHSKKHLMHPAMQQLFADLESPRWLAFLEEVTGIRGLLADPTLDGSSGLHKSLRGCYLNVHRESVGHNGHPDWKRQLNLLLYFNKGWQEDWNGELELHDHRTMSCVKRITPFFNRMVLFHTNEVAFHGNPGKLVCPEGVVRKSLATYYFSQQSAKLWLNPVLYRPAASDGAVRRARIALNNLALRVYFPLRKYTPINDEMVEKVMRGLRLSRD
jgi:Rps23 Pro-64 3,4-dihydroxylase Tpa1-like proline 4-hydroxylase